MESSPFKSRLDPARLVRELAAIVQSSNDAIFGKELDGTITSWNAAAERMYGYTSTEAVRRSIEMLEPPDRRGEIKSLMARVMAGERIEQFETVRLHKDGSRVDVMLTISPIKDETDAIVGLSTIARDVRDRREAEAALRRSEESYRQLFEGHPAGMWVYDPETFRFLAVNAAALAASGYSREEFLAMTTDDFLLEGDRAKLRSDIDAAAGTVQQGRWRLQMKDGSGIHVDTWARSIEFAGRQARLVLAQDVTEQRRLEEQLRQTQKMEAIGRLAGGIAHDFNNLLLVIRGYSAMLLKRFAASELEHLLEHLQQIDGAAERASEFTQQLLAFSRQQVLRLEVTDLNAVVLDTLRLLERSLGEDVEVKTELDPTVSAILVDRSQLTQAVLNLAINARDAMPNGGTLRIRTANTELGEAYAAGREDVIPGPYALLQITDTGMGMDDETRHRAFDPFFTTKDEGTGLGLATVYGLVKQSGGHISLYSEAELGTTFKLYFPITHAAAVRAPTRPPVDSLNGHEVILVVEDAEMVRALVTATLESYGYQVLSAGGAEEAIAVASQANGSIDLLMTDVVMPGKNGRELAEALVETYPFLKVLFTSGYPADTVVRHGIADARAAFIEKPYLPDELALKVREVLAQEP